MYTWIIVKKKYENLKLILMCFSVCLNMNDIVVVMALFEPPNTILELRKVFKCQDGKTAATN
jgi:hypothetical protein